MLHESPMSDSLITLHRITNHSMIRDSAAFISGLFVPQRDLFFKKGGVILRIDGTNITFTAADSHFLKKFGLIEAGEMVMNFKSLNDLPFIYDTYQLADFLSLRRKSMFSIFKSDKNRFYEKVSLKKKNGGVRIINAPDELMKSIQRRINYEIVSKLAVSEYATAYKSGCNLKNNADKHIGKKYLLKMDITDFFGSIRFEQVYSSVFNTKYFPKQIGVILTSFCCLNDVLPQGAPTSPGISNLVLKNFDDNIGAWCKARGITYTRYCDDLTFSSDNSLYHVYVKVEKMLEDMGFEINKKKTHFVTSATRQTVTGLTVNEKVTVSKEYKRKLRQEIYYILKYGAADSLIHAGADDYIRHGTISVTKYLDIIIGKTNYVLSIEPENEYFKKSLYKLRLIRSGYSYDN